MYSTNSIFIIVIFLWWLIFQRDLQIPHLAKTLWKQGAK